MMIKIITYELNGRVPLTIKILLLFAYLIGISNFKFFMLILTFNKENFKNDCFYIDMFD